MKTISDLGKAVLLPCFTLIVYGILHNVIYEKFAPWLWGYLDLSEGKWLDIACSLVCIILLILGWKSKKSVYSATHVGVFFSLVLLLALCWKDCQFVSLSFLKLFNKFPIWTVLLCCFSFGLLSHHLCDCFCRQPPKDDFVDDSVLVFHDLPIEDIEKDELAFDIIAKRIASSIIQFNGEKSLSIGITGVWGSGKTTMLNFVKECLSIDKDIILLDFSPRHSVSIQDIQKDFLYDLGNKLAKYHSGAHQLTEKYLRAIGNLPDGMWGARVLGIIGQQDVSSIRQKISGIIRAINKKVVVFIDDFDRLTGDEIQEVLKIIDKNAAFSRTFFITAYDKTYSNNIISKYLGDQSAQRNYTDKYFNIEINVPVRYPSRYNKVLREYIYVLSDERIIKSSHEEIDNALARVYRFIPRYLATIRDIKRFVNLLSINLPLVENDVLLDDFLLVTLIHYRFPEEYKKLARHEYVSLRNDNSAYGKKIYLLNVIEDPISCRDILDLLFSEKTSKKEYRSVAYKNSFDHYFYDYDARDLKFNDLSQILNPIITPDEFHKVIKPWLSDNRLNSDLIEFVLSYEKSIHCVEDAKRYLRLFFLTRTFCESRDLYIASLSYLLSDNLEENIKAFNKKDEKDYKGFFRSALNDMFEWSLSIETLHDALHAVNTYESGDTIKLIFTPEDLMEYALKKVEKAVAYLLDGSINNWEVYRALRACVIEFLPYGGGETIAPKAIAVVKDAMITAPGLFLQDVLYHVSSQDSTSSTIQLCLKKDFPFVDLFQNWEGLQNFVSELSEESDKVVVQCLSEYVSLCVAQNTWTPIIQVNGDVNQIQQSDYSMYNKLFEGEDVSA